MGSLIEFTKDMENEFYRKKKYGRLYKPLKSVQFFLKRVCGKYSFEDQVVIANTCEPPIFFLKHGVHIGHAFGITLSIDSIGADCAIAQNVMIGSSGKEIPIDGFSTGHKPKIGNLVRIYPNSLVNGEIHIGDYVIIAAGAFVNKSVPNHSVVYGHNEIKPLKSHHVKYLQRILWLNMNVYDIIPGLIYKNEKMYIDVDYAEKRDLLMAELEGMKGRLEG